MMELFTIRPQWSRGELIKELRVGRYRTDQWLTEALATGRLRKTGNTQAQRYRLA